MFAVSTSILQIFIAWHNYLRAVFECFSRCCCPEDMVCEAVIIVRFYLHSSEWKYGHVRLKEIFLSVTHWRLFYPMIVRNNLKVSVVIVWFELKCKYLEFSTIMCTSPIVRRFPFCKESSYEKWFSSSLATPPNNWWDFFEELDGNCLQRRKLYV